MAPLAQIPRYLEHIKQKISNIPTRKMTCYMDTVGTAGFKGTASQGFSTTVLLIYQLLLVPLDMPRKCLILLNTCYALR